MKKLSFNDRFNQTEMVIKNRIHFIEKNIKSLKSFNKNLEFVEIKRIRGEIFFLVTYKGRQITKVKPQYKIGEIVSIAQSGKEIYKVMYHRWGGLSSVTKDFKTLNSCEKWWYNKQNTPPEQCAYCIKIDDIRIRRAQDINELDAFLHGIKYNSEIEKYVVEEVKRDGCTYVEEFKTAVQAYAYLFDKLNYPGAWADNPYVLEYQFHSEINF